jgi:hypothetical protein
MTHQLPHQVRYYCKKSLCSTRRGPFDDMTTALVAMHTLSSLPCLITATTDVLWFPYWIAESLTQDSSWYYKTDAEAAVRGPFRSMVLYDLINDLQLPATTLFRQGDVSLWWAASNSDIRADDARFMAGKSAESDESERRRLETTRRRARNRKHVCVCFIVILTLLLVGKGLYSIHQSIKHMYDSTTEELVREGADRKAMDKRSEQVRTSRPILAKKNPVQFEKPAPIIAKNLASDLPVHPRVVKREVAQLTTSQQLYDQAVAARKLYPEKSWELLDEIIKREEKETVAGVDRLFLTWGLVEELGSDPYALYRNALFCSKTNLEGARRCLAAALEHRPDEQLKQKILSLQTELGVDVNQVVGSEASQTSVPTKETTTQDKNIKVSGSPSDNEDQMRRIFKDWSKQRGAALKKAGRLPKARYEAYMRAVDRALVRELTRKYKITHEKLDRIEAHGAQQNWW